MPVKLTPRLMTALPYIRGDRLVADIGTDHAYLPIYLCEQERLTPTVSGRGDGLRALAADINRGPVERAEAHIAAAGLGHCIHTLQTDGLAGLESFDPEDILIFGMGGELIAHILERAPWVRREGKRLILQPMTHGERLRAYLLSAGFGIVGETLSREGERIYQTICAEPLPQGEEALSLSLGELMVGQAIHYGADPVQRELYVALLDKVLALETRAREARRQGGQDTQEQDRLIASLHALWQDSF